MAPKTGSDFAKWQKKTADEFRAAGKYFKVKNSKREKVRKANNELLDKDEEDREEPQTYTFKNKHVENIELGTPIVLSGYKSFWVEAGSNKKANPDLIYVPALRLAGNREDIE